jgi:hypothetical protein
VPGAHEHAVVVDRQEIAQDIGVPRDAQRRVFRVRLGQVVTQPPDDDADAR